MILRIGAWNIRDGFSDESRIPAIVSNIDAMDVDVAVFPEAYKEGEEQFLGEVVERLMKLGYIPNSTPYGDDDGRLDRHGLMVINRLDIEGATPVRMRTRNALYLPIGEYAFLGAHLDDRAEARRMAQAEEAISSDIVAGDCNSVMRRVPLAKATTILPAHFPTAERPTIAGWERKCNVTHRIGAMMSSRVSNLMETANFQDANDEHKATWPSRRPFLELDRIMHKRELHSRQFTVQEQVPGFDHLAISAVIED